MIKDLVEDLILILLVLVAVYLAWQYWLKDKVLGGVQAVNAKAAQVAAGTKTIAAAAASPVETVKDLFKSTTSTYISQEQFRANIEAIKRNLAGKQ